MVLVVVDPRILLVRLDRHLLSLNFKSHLEAEVVVFLVLVLLEELLVRLDKEMRHRLEVQVLLEIMVAVAAVDLLLAIIIMVEQALKVVKYLIMVFFLQVKVRVDNMVVEQVDSLVGVIMVEQVVELLYMVRG